MANRPLYNGTARVGVDNNQGSPLTNGFVFRAKVGSAPNAGDEAIANSPFQAKAGDALTIFYDIRKYGAGVEVDTPNFAQLLVLSTLSGTAAFDSGDLIGGALPLTGSFNVTISEVGTYEIRLVMRLDGATGANSWSADSDGAFSRGAAVGIVRLAYADKGRLRYGTDLTAITLTERENALPAKLAIKMNAGLTATEEALRVALDFLHSRRTGSLDTATTSVRQRRNGTAMVDSAVSVSNPTAMDAQTDIRVNQINYPTLVDTLYDVLSVVGNVSNLHTNNTPEYAALADPAEASGAWMHFTGAGAGLALIDFQTVAKLAGYTANANATIENTHAQDSDTYAEDGAKVPTGPETADYVATAQNMTVKSGRILNSRGEPLGGIFISTQVVYEPSGSVRDSWGIDNAVFKTLANGWQDQSRVVQVVTPPAGVHRLMASGYFPAGTLSTPATREVFATRTEQGAPGAPPDLAKGRNWIAPASFFRAVVVVPPVVPEGLLVDFSVHVFNKSVEIDADLLPVCRVFKSRQGFETAAFATPVLTKRAGTTGIYDGSFTPSLLADKSIPEIYEVSASATVLGFPKTFGDALIAVAKNRHDKYAFNPTGLEK